MSLQNIDFQALLHQNVSQIIQHWQNQAVPADKAEELAGQLFNMGMIAVQQMMQSPEIQVENAPAPIEITPPMAEKITVIFIHGLSAAYLLWYQLGVPQQEGMDIIQNTALYIFEQSKQMASAALSAPSNADGFKDEQMIQWLAQTSQEAFQFYLTELEKQRGPIPRQEPEVILDPPLMEDSEPSAQDPFESDDDVWQDPAPPIEIEQATPVQSQTVERREEASRPAASNSLPDNLYQLIATSLVLSTHADEQKQIIIRSHDPAYHADLLKYQDANHIPSSIDFKKLSNFVKLAKVDIAQQLSHYPKPASYYRKKIHQLIVKSPQMSPGKLFQLDRANIQHYMKQFEMNASESFKPPLLPPGVMQSIFDFLQKAV